MSSALVRVAACLAVVVSAGCKPELEGEPLGRFKISEALTDNGCGSSAVPAQAEFDFELELRETENEVLWHRPGEPAIFGRRRDRTMTFESGSSYMALPPIFEVGTGACWVDQREVVSLTLPEASGDAGAPEQLGGAHEIEVSPVPGTDCRAAYAAIGGPFLALPCRISYELSGTLLTNE